VVCEPRCRARVRAAARVEAAVLRARLTGRRPGTARRLTGRAAYGPPPRTAAAYPESPQDTGRYAYGPATTSRSTRPDADRAGLLWPGIAGGSQRCWWTAVLVFVSLCWQTC